MVCCIALPFVVACDCRGVQGQASDAGGGGDLAGGADGASSGDGSGPPRDGSALDGGNLDGAQRDLGRPPPPLDGGSSPCTGDPDVWDVPLDVTDGGWQLEPRLTWTGIDYALAWADTDLPLGSHPFIARGALVSPTGQPAAPTAALAPVAGAPTTFLQESPRLGWNGASAIAVLDDNRQTNNVQIQTQPQAATLGAAGTLWTLGTSGNDDRWAAVDWDPIDNQWGVAWNEIAGPALYDLQMARLDAAGVFVIGSNVPIVPMKSPTFNGAAMSNLAGGVPFLWNGGGWTFVYAENRSIGIGLRRLDPMGGFVSQSTIGSAPGVYPSTSVAWSGAEYGVGWVEYTAAGPRQVLYASADASGVFSTGPILLSNAANDSDWVGVRWTGSEWLATWEEDDGTGQKQIWTARLDGTQVLAGTRRVLTCGTYSSEQPDPSWNGTYAVVAYLRRTSQARHIALLLVP
jgi:hypothetical protein